MRLLATLVVCTMLMLVSQFARGQCPTSEPIIEVKHNTCFDAQNLVSASNGRITLRLPNDNNRYLLIIAEPDTTVTGTAVPNYLNPDRARIVFSAEFNNGEKGTPENLRGQFGLPIQYTHALAPFNALGINYYKRMPDGSVPVVNLGEGRPYMWMIKRVDGTPTGAFCNIPNYADPATGAVPGRSFGFVGVLQPEITATSQAVRCWGKKDGSITLNIQGLRNNANDTPRQFIFNLYDEISNKLIFTERQTIPMNVINWQYTYRNLEGGNAPLLPGGRPYRWEVISTVEQDNVNRECIRSANITVIEPTRIIPTLETRDGLRTIHVSCNGAADGQIDPVFSGGTPYTNRPPYDYRWARFEDPTPFSFERRVRNLRAGRYRCTVIDANGCDSTFDFVVNQPNPLVISLTNVEGAPLTPGNNPGDFNVGNILCTYNDPTNPNRRNGQFRVRVTGGNLTTIPYFLEDSITRPFPLLTISRANAVRHFELDRINADGTRIRNFRVNYDVPVRLSNGTYIEYSALTSNPDAGNVNNEPLPPGTYEIRIWDEINPLNGSEPERNLNCMNMMRFSILEPAPLIVNARVDSVSCFGGRNGNIYVSVAGGQPPYEYRWFRVNNGNLDSMYTDVDRRPVTTPNLIGYPAGEYVVRVYDATSQSVDPATFPNGGTDQRCYFERRLIIGQPAPLVAIFERIEAPTCFGASDGIVRVRATGGTFRNIAPNQNLGFPAKYSYTFRLYDNNWNSVGILRQLNQNDASTGVEFTNLPAGIYHLEVTDDRGCRDTSDRFYVPAFFQDGSRRDTLDRTRLATNATSTDTPLSLHLTATRSENITLYLDGDDSNAQDAAHNLDSFGDYDAQKLNDLLVNLTPVTCNGGSDGAFTIQPLQTMFDGGRSPYAYRYYLTGGPLTQPMEGVEVDPAGTGPRQGRFDRLVAGNYTVMVAYDNGANTPDRECYATLDIRISQPQPLVAYLHADSAACNDLTGGQVYVKVTGGRPYKNQRNLSPSGLFSYVYDYEWYENGSTTTTALTIDSLIRTSVNRSPNTNPEIPTIWSARVIDGSGCVTWAQRIVPQHGSQHVIPDPSGRRDTVVWVPRTLSVRIDQIYPVTCNQSNNPLGDPNQGKEGELRAVVRGGKRPFSYYWMRNGVVMGQDSAMRNVDAAHWSVQVFDANACLALDTFVVTQPPRIELSLSNLVDPTLCNRSNGSVDFLFAADTTTFVPANSPLNLPNRYRAFISNSQQGQVNFGADVVALGSATPLQSIDREFVLPAPDAQGNIRGTFRNIGEGIHTITIYDLERGCTITRDVRLQVRNQIPIAGLKYDTDADIRPGAQLQGRLIGRDTVSCFGARDGAIQIWAPIGTGNGSGNGINLMYEWFGPNNESVTTIPGIVVENGGRIIRNLPSGRYKIIVTDTNSTTGSQCSFVDFRTIHAPALLTADTSTVAATCYDVNNGSINLTINGGTAPYRYTVAYRNTRPFPTDTIAVSGRNATIRNLYAGKYDVTVLDANGCRVTRLVEIRQPSPFMIAMDSLHVWDRNAVVGSIPGVNWADVEYVTDSLADWSRDISCNGAKDGSLSFMIPGDAVAPINLRVWNGGVVVHDTTLTQVRRYRSISFYWSFSRNLAPGNYTVTASSANGCVDTIETVIEDVQPLSYVSDIKIDARHCGDVAGVRADRRGQRIVEARGGRPPYHYSLYNDKDSLISYRTTMGGNAIFEVSPGSYYVIVQDGSGDEQPKAGLDLRSRCSLRSTTQTIAQPAPPVLTVTNVKHVTCRGLNNGQGLARATGGNNTGNDTVPTFSYIWRLTANNTIYSIDSFPKNLISGRYQVTAINRITNCRADVFVDIVEPQAALSTTQTHVQPSCFGFPTGIITTNTTGGTAPYTYRWFVDRNEAPNNFPAREEIRGAVTNSIQDLGPGIYTVEVTDAQGCINTLTDIVLQYPPRIFTQNLNVTNVSCPNGADGRLQLTIIGGVPPYKVTWLRGNTVLRVTERVAEADSLQLRGLSAGTYTYVIEDVAGCRYSEDKIVTQPAAVSIAVSTVNIGCSGANNDGSARITITGGTAPYNTTVTLNGRTIQTFAGSTATVSNLAPGTYNVAVRDANVTVDAENCSYGTTFAITNTPLASEITARPVKCFEPNASLKNGSFSFRTTGGQAPYIYTIRNVATGTTTSFTDAGSSSNFITTENFVDGTYEVSVRDSRSPQACSLAARTLEVRMAAAPMTITTRVERGTTCRSSSDGRATVTVSGGVSPYTYEWSSGETNPDARRLPAGAQSLVVVDGYGCRIVTSVVVPQPQTELTVEARVTNVTTCQGNDGAIVLNVTGGSSPYTFNWSNGSTNQNLSNLTAGTYTGTVTDANGCVKSATLTLSEPPAIAVTAQTTSPTCNRGNNGAISLTITSGTAPFSFNWTGPGGPYTTQNLTGITAGTYVGRIIDRNGCIAQATIAVTEPAAIQTTLTPNRIECGASNGEIVLLVNGNNAPFVYSWSNGATTKDLSGLRSGIYSVTVTDARGCTTVGSTEVDINSNLRLNDVVTNISCNGRTDGSIALNVSGGENPVTIRWATGEDVGTLTNLRSGIYAVTVSDARGCERVKSFRIEEPAALVATSVKTDVTCGGANNGAIDLSVAGGTEPYSYVWSNQARTQDLANIGGGTYVVTVTDARGCSATREVTVIEPVALVVTGTVNPVGCTPNSTDGGINITVDGGVPAYRYAWSNNATTQNVANLAEGVYQVTVTDVTNCSIVRSFTVTRNTEMAIPVIRSTPDRPSGTLTICGTGPSFLLTVENYEAAGTEFLWSNGESDRSIVARRPGTYIVTVRNACGERNSAAYVIRGGDLPAAPVVEGPVRRVVGQNVFCEISSSISDANTFNFQWFKGDTLLQGATAATYNITQDGNYSVRITNKTTGCENTSDRKAVSTASCTNNAISQAINQTAITLYPNPATSTVSVKADWANIKVVNVEVMNALGQVVMTQSYNVNTNATIELSIVELAAGIYTVKATAGERVWVGKVVKQ